MEEGEGIGGHLENEFDRKRNHHYYYGPARGWEKQNGDK